MCIRDSIETDVLNNFKRLGVAAEVLDGKARLAQLHAIFHMDAVSYTQLDVYKRQQESLAWLKQVEKTLNGKKELQRQVLAY